MCGDDKTCGCGCEAKPSRASMRRERDVVLTDREGRPFDRPRRADFDTEGDYLDAYDDYRRRVSEAMSNRGMQLSLERDRDLYAQARKHGAALDRASARRDPSRTKTCAMCGEEKSVDDFYLLYKDDPERRQAKCKRCDNRNRIARQPGGVDPRDAYNRNVPLGYDDIVDVSPEEISASWWPSQNTLRLSRASRRGSSRDPSQPPPRIVGALYYLEWDAHDEGDEGTYVYQGVYSQTGADMFRRVSRVPSQRVTLYLFPHEVRYLELLKPLRGAKVYPATSYNGIPIPPSSAPRRRAGPELFPGRVLTRSARAMPRVWDVGIVGPSIARAAQFQGFRRIDNQMFGVWSANGVLYAQPRRP